VAIAHAEQRLEEIKHRQDMDQIARFEAEQEEQEADDGGTGKSS
jgi:hypothetical protein